MSSHCPCSGQLHPGVSVRSSIKGISGELSWDLGVPVPILETSNLCAFVFELSKHEVFRKSI